jgi:DNA-binding LacI/PurR family transcriptional regulator
MGVNIQQIAYEAGVSTATVSRVVNGQNVRHETAEKVRAVMEKMQYRPHRFARGLATQATGFLGVVSPPLDDPYVASVISGIEEEAKRQGKLITLSVIHNPGVDEREAVHTLINPPLAEGLLILLPTLDMEKQIRELAQKKYPMVIVSEKRFEELAPSVLIDNLNGAKQAVHYLAGKGHQRIGFITGRPELTDSGDRLEGYRLALGEAGLKVDESLILSGNYELSAGVSAGQRFLEMANPPTAVFASNDRMAIGLLKALQIAKKEGAFKVMGFDDIPMGSLTSPTLTTMGYDLKELGKLAVHKLTRIIQGEEKSRSTLMLKTHLVVRDSA